MNLLPMAFASGWASGVNAYATVLLLGLLGRYAGVDSVPAGLERTDVLVVAAALYLWEFVVDKIPYVDSAWDVVSTAIRPTVGAVIAALIAGDRSNLGHLALVAVGGGTALASHMLKAGVRLGVNVSPEPVSNIATSVAEDFSVAGVVALAVFHPVAAAVVAGVLLVCGVGLVVLLASRIRRGRRALAARRARRRAPQVPMEVPR